MTTLGFLLLAIEILSVNNIMYFSNDDFKATSSLYGEIWPQELELYSPTDIFFKDNKLIVFDDENPDHTILVIDLNDRGINLEIGEVGGVSKALMLPVTYDSGFEDETFWVFDNYTNRFNQFSFDSEAKMPLNSKKIKRSMITPQWINEQKIIDGGLYDGDYIFEVTDLKSGAVEGFGAWSDIVKTDDAKSFRNSMQGYIYTNPDRTLAAYLGLKSNLITILDLASKETTALIGPVSDRVMPYWFRSPSIKTFQMGFIGKSKIFALYSGKEVIPERVSESSICKEIYTFSFDGTPENRFLLNHSIQTFAVDEERRKIFGINFQSDRPRVIEFSF